MPLTGLLPKPLCPVANRPLLDLACDRTAAHVSGLAVNVHHGAEAITAHLDGRAHVSAESPEALGTAGGLGRLRPWIDGRHVLVTNADAWLPAEVGDVLEGFVAGWDRERVRLLCVRDPDRGDFGDLRYCGVALLPWPLVAGLEPLPSGLFETMWRDLAATGALDLVVWDGDYVDCGTPRDYLAANLLASAGRPVIAPDARVAPTARLERCVVWPGAAVGPTEVLHDAVRTSRLTVLVR